LASIWLKRINSDSKTLKSITNSAFLILVYVNKQEGGFHDLIFHDNTFENNPIQIFQKNGYSSNYENIIISYEKIIMNNPRISLA
jgi:hypothetical protein